MDIVTLFALIVFTVCGLVLSTDCDHYYYYHHLQTQAPPRKSWVRFIASYLFTLSFLLLLFKFISAFFQYYQPETDSWDDCKN